MQDFEQSIIHTPKAKVLGFPVGIDIYYFNPFRVCNLSPNGEWDPLKKSLQTKYHRFLSLSKIKRIETPPIGPGKEVLLNKTFRPEFEKIKRKIDKPNARIVWKIFWLNHIGDQYKSLPRDIVELSNTNLSDHSLAVLFHFQAIDHTLALIEGKETSFKKHLWEQALVYWDKVMKDDNFWQEIQEIILTETEKGYYEFREHDISSLKQEVISAIYHSVSTIPLKLIEEDLEIAEKEEWISNFLSIILRSPLGDDQFRITFVKRIAENRISKDVVRAFASDDFRSWANQGKYERLYERGMKFLDSIHTNSEALTQELDTFNTLTSSVRGFAETPGLHTRAIGPLFDAIQASQITQDQEIDRQDKDRSIFTFLILCLRMLSEFKLDSHSQILLMEEVDWMNNRFSFNKLSTKEKEKLNQAAWQTKDILNSEIPNRYYLAQYCYFQDGEFADPSASIIKKFVKDQTSFTLTSYSLIPRSELAKQVHEKRLSAAEAVDQGRASSQKENLKTQSKILKLEIDSLSSQITEKEKALQVFRDQEQAAKDKAAKAFKELTLKIAQRVKTLQKEGKYHARILELNQQEEALSQEKNDLHSDLLPEIKQTQQIHRKQKYLRATAWIVGFGGMSSLLAIPLFGGVTIAIIGFVGAWYLNDRVKKYGKLERSLSSEFKKKLGPIHLAEEESAMQHTRLQAEIKRAAEEEHQAERRNIERQQKASLDRLGRESFGLKKEYEELRNAINLSKQKLEALKKAQRQNSRIRPKADGNRHPVVNHHKVS